jgi:hypothetical protein
MLRTIPRAPVGNIITPRMMFRVSPASGGLKLGLSLKIGKPFHSDSTVELAGIE